jgi:hypothetical protein
VGAVALLGEHSSEVDIEVLPLEFVDLPRDFRGVRWPETDCGQIAIQRDRSQTLVLGSPRVLGHESSLVAGGGDPGGKPYRSTTTAERFPL